MNICIIFYFEEEITNFMERKIKLMEKLKMLLISGCQDTTCYQEGN
jgi:hypothetical protein